VETENKEGIKKVKKEIKKGIKTWRKGWRKAACKNCIISINKQKE